MTDFCDYSNIFYDHVFVFLQNMCVLKVVHTQRRNTSLTQRMSVQISNFSESKTVVFDRYFCKDENRQNWKRAPTRRKNNNRSKNYWNQWEVSLQLIKSFFRFLNEFNFRCNILLQQTKKLYPHIDVIFHISVRLPENVIVLNTFINGNDASLRKCRVILFY